MPTANMASEDFARVAALVPGAQFGIGARPLAAPPDAPFDHSPHAVFGDGALPVGAAFLAEVAERRLRRRGGRTATAAGLTAPSGCFRAVDVSAWRHTRRADTGWGAADSTAPGPRIVVL
ncbi:hypothetical protein ACWC24_18755 [Streptomyces sp. NPDC001443]